YRLDLENFDDRPHHVNAADVRADVDDHRHAQVLSLKRRRQAIHGIVNHAVVAANRPEAAFERVEVHDAGPANRASGNGGRRPRSAGERNRGNDDQRQQAHEKTIAFLEQIVTNACEESASTTKHFLLAWGPTPRADALAP